MEIIGNTRESVERPPGVQLYLDDYGEAKIYKSRWEMFSDMKERSNWLFSCEQSREQKDLQRRPA